MHRTVLYCILYCIVLSCIASYCLVVHRTVLYCILYCIVLSCILYCILLSCVLYCIVLSCIASYCLASNYFPLCDSGLLYSFTQPLFGNAEESIQRGLSAWSCIVSYCTLQCRIVSPRIWLSGLLNTELSPKRYWRGPSSHEMGLAKCT